MNGKNKEKVTLDMLSRSMGEGVLGAEVSCHRCDCNVELSYYYIGHWWEGMCPDCRLPHCIDLSVIIEISKQASAMDWDAALKELHR